LSGAVKFGGCGSVEIEYWQGGLRLVAFDLRAVSRSLPQDEATAAAVLGALLARNIADDRWPGVYRAVVREGSGVVEVAEDDLRVAAVRELLRGCRERGLDGQPARRDFTEEEFAQALALARTVGPEPVVPLPLSPKPTAIDIDSAR
jgi:hypothetical protein